MHAMTRIAKLFSSSSGKAANESATRIIFFIFHFSFPSKKVPRSVAALFPCTPGFNQTPFQPSSEIFFPLLFGITHCDKMATRCDFETTYCNKMTTYCDSRAKHCNGETTYCNKTSTHCDSRTTYCDREASYCNKMTTYCDSRAKHCNGRTTYCNGETKHCAFGTTRSDFRTKRFDKMAKTAAFDLLRWKMSCFRQQ